MGSQGDAHDIELASIALERANDVMAACLLHVFVAKSRTEQSPELNDLIDRSKVKGGQFARAVLLEDLDLLSNQNQISSNWPLFGGA